MSLTHQVLLCFLTFATMRAAQTVRIHELKVPKITKHGSSVVLDCDYTLEDSADHTGLVVKWYFNDHERPVYQWIPGTKGPQSLGVLKGKLNLDYRASTDQNTMHRALHILKPSADLSGEYTCVVSTFQNEDRRSKKMLVFVPEKNFQLRQMRGSDGFMKVVCSAESVFPKPDIAIYMSHSELESRKVEQRESGELFDVSAVAMVPESVLELSTNFSCELRIPDANYTARREAMYYPGSGSYPTKSSSYLVVITYALVKYISFLNGERLFLIN